MPDKSMRKMVCIAVPRFWTGKSIVTPTVGVTYSARKPESFSQWWRFYSVGQEGNPAFLVGERYVADAFTEEYEAEEVTASEVKSALSTSFHAADALLKYLDSFPQETVDGVKVADTAKVVDLDIEFTPVLVEAPYEHAQDIPRPCQVSKTEGGKYIVYAPTSTQIVSAEDLKIMRARFLLWNGYLYRLMAQGQLLPHPKPAQYVAWYHGGSLHIPQILIDHYNSDRADETEVADDA